MYAAKYHHDGHRACGFSCTPTETKKLKGICPECKKPLTIGVDYRVNEIADHPESFKPKNHKVVEYIIPLPEIIAEMFNVGVQSKRVQAEYEKVYTALGDEFSILRTIPPEKIRGAGFAELADAISRMRKGDVHIEPGFDGVYGKIHLFKNDLKRKMLGD